MKPTRYLATVSASGPAVDLTEGHEVTLSDAAIAADLERAGYVVKLTKGLTLARAKEIAAARVAEEAQEFRTAARAAIAARRAARKAALAQAAAPDPAAE
ncbi:hypothetical protein [Rhodovulum marinum]|uniref:Uncharacterized protein n=1 Tax=Rhodovulum marinum TaxID=320662 RepID=A0A4R2Q7P7_9RHOB|nr:hypothetical protein [Rhodovulum marinum]TCP43938.1 hypothetical protein EV662_10121 [Rhodovulum marinum]